MIERKVAFHTAASATAVGTVASNSGLAEWLVQISGTFVASVAFEAQLDGTNWDSIPTVKVDDGTIATTATATGFYRVPTLGARLFRCNLTWTSGTSITVTGIGTDVASGSAMADIEVGSITAGETHIGEVGGSSDIITVTPAITAGAYTAADIVGAVQTIIGAARLSGQPTVLQSVVVRDKAKLSQAMTIWFFDRTPPTGTYTDNLALTIHDTDLGYCVGRIRILAADYDAAADNAVATVSGIGLLMKPSGSANLFAIAQATGTAPTYASTSDLTFLYSFIQD